MRLSESSPTVKMRIPSFLRSETPSLKEKRMRKNQNDFENKINLHQKYNENNFSM